MEHYTFSLEEYKKALKGAGPKVVRMIMDLAINDPGIDLEQYDVLLELADKAGVPYL